MANLTRKLLKVFAGSAANNGQFGSAQAGTDITSLDPDTIQALAAWAQGWLSATISGQRLPTLEEMQGIQYVLSYMTSYLYQQGIGAYLATEEYAIYALAKDPSNGVIYQSLQANNIGNALSNPAYWQVASLAPDASTTVKGKVQLATNAEAQALTDALKAITPATLAQAFKGGNQGLTANGFQRLPGGLILQWGIVASLAAGGSANVNFPLVFPSAVVFVGSNNAYAGNSGTIVTVTGVNFGALNNFVLRNHGGSLQTNAGWFAIGY